MRGAALTLLLAFALPGAAGQVEDLTRLVDEAARSPDPTMAFLRGAAALPDFQLSQADVQRALEAAGVPQEGPLRQLLGPTLELKKKGDRISIQRSHPTVLAGPGSAIELGRKVDVRLRLEGQDAELDKISGIRVGEQANDLYDLWRVKFTREGGRPVAKVTAGAAIFSKTVTVDLGPAPGGGGSTPATPQPPQTGITQAMGQSQR